MLFELGFDRRIHGVREELPVQCVVGGELFGMIAAQARVKQQVALRVANQYRELNRPAVGGPAATRHQQPLRGAG